MAENNAPADRFVIGFDLDGTLIDTAGDLAAAVDAMLTEIGRPPIGVAAVTRLIGGGARRMVRLALDQAGIVDEATIARCYDRFLAHYAADIAHLSRPFPGALAALDALSARGIVVAIVTNKPEALALKLLDALGLTDRFACIIGGDTLGPGKAKPAPDPILEMMRRCDAARGLFVGDSVYDVAAARAAGLPVVAVRFGYIDGPAEALGADAVIDGFAALIPAVDSLCATWSTGDAPA